MSEERTLLGARIPEDLKELVDRHEKANQDVVEQALWQYLSAEQEPELRRRLDEIDDRTATIRRERNERDRELEELKEKRETLEKRLESKVEMKEHQLSEAREVLTDVPRDPTNPAIQNWADKLNMTPSELIEELGEREGDEPW